jgi:hypothetical protein
VSQKPWHPPNNSHPHPQTIGGTLSIQDLMGIYGFLNSIANPTEKIIEAKGYIENIILDFSKSLGAIASEQARQQ